MSEPEPPTSPAGAPAEPHHVDAEAHVRGRSRYVDDEPAPAGMLQAAVLGSPVAHGRILALDVTPALAVPGVVAVLTAADIPGENQIGAVLPDEPLLAAGEVHHRGQPVALVVAEDWLAARRGVAAIAVEIAELGAVTDPRVACERGQLIAPPQRMELGDVDAAWATCALVLEGRCEIGGQEHVYLETQRARALPGEGGAVRVLSSTQSPYAGQRAIARVLGLPMHLVEVDVRRLGGGFGGKEDQATAWACLAALAATRTGRAVELVLSRADDLAMTGKRHPYSADWKIGVDADGRLLAFEARYFQNSGATCDLSLAVLARTLFHGTNSYFVPNVRLWGAACRTNLPSNTAFRGFGGPQGMFVVEAALAAVAERLGLPREELQRRNLLRPEDTFPYGQVASTVRVAHCFAELDRDLDLVRRRQAIAAFNRSSFAVKKGMAVMPVTFGISFTSTFMNQAGALLHVYTDGSVCLTTGGIEMGQGLSTNLALVVARALGIGRERVRVESTSTARVANMSPSAASSTTLLNGNAALAAAEKVKARLLRVAGGALGATAEALAIVDERVTVDGRATEWDWVRLVQTAYRQRVDLSAHGFYATPEIWFDTESGRGSPFAYHVCGAALVEVTVDCLRGTYTLDAVHVVHDLGRPLSRLVDLGQVEGGIAQGLGWMTLEELRYDDRGRLLSAALATYKVPDAGFLPRELSVRFLEDDPSVPGPFGSKAVGEPPLMYGIGAYFALRDAMRAFRPDLALPFDAPLTPEKVLMHTHPELAAGLDAAARAAASASPAAAAHVGAAVAPGSVAAAPAMEDAALAGPHIAASSSASTPSATS
jgi:xanthine dehydrogenase large subunit